MYRVYIDCDDKYTNLDISDFSAWLPNDVKIVASANDADATIDYGSDLKVDGDDITVCGTKLKLPIHYQGLRFHPCNISHPNRPSRSRHYDLRAQLMIPNNAWIVGYIGMTKEFHDICERLDDSIYIVGAILDTENMKDFEWKSNTRAIQYPGISSNRSIVYRTFDVTVENEDWARPRLESIASGVPVSTIEELTSIDSQEDLCEILRPVDNDTVLEHDVSYFIRDFVDDILDLEEDSPLISICINVYNREHILPYAIDSALRQAYDNIELILVDDESKDRSIEIIERYADEDDRISYQLLEKNVGCPESWSQSIKLADGQLVTYTSSDNIQDYSQIWHLNRFWQQTNYDIVYGKPLYFGGSNKIVYSTNVNRNLALSCAGLGPSFLIPNWLLDEVDLMHTEDLYVEDTSMTTDLCTIGASVGLLDKRPMYYYREGDPTSLTAKVKAMGGYRKLLLKMAENRINRRNKYLRNLDAIYIPKSTNIAFKSIIKLLELGFDGTVYIGEGDMPKIKYNRGIPPITPGTCGSCPWGSSALVLGPHGSIKRCPYKDTSRGKAHGDFIINKNPRPCYMAETCPSVT